MKTVVSMPGHWGGVWVNTFKRSLLVQVSVLKYFIEEIMLDLSLLHKKYWSTKIKAKCSDHEATYCNLYCYYLNTIYSIQF